MLNAGAALVLNLAPRFQMVASTRGSGLIEGVDPSSPAGQWIRQNAIHYRNIDLRFVDPHNGLGGFGASSAQFLFVYRLTEILKGDSASSTPEAQAESVWRAYRQLESVSQEGLRPSGADIVGQLMGGLSEVHTEPFAVAKKQWPFDDCDILILHTGLKLATHEHLRGLQRVNTEELAFIYSRANEAFAQEQADEFYNAINDYHAELLELGLVADHTKILTATFLSKPFVRAVKGCGAMGSDTLVVFVGRENRGLVEELISELQESFVGLRCVGDLSQIAKGLEIRTIEDAGVTTEAGSQS